MNTAVIVAAARTPIGRMNGALSNLTAVELGTQLLVGMLESSTINPMDIDDVILGQVLTAGCGQNPARQTAIHAGLDNKVPAITINKVCGSGLKAIQLATQAIRCGDAKLVVAGGQESMSLAPHVLPNSRTGQRFGNWTALDSMSYDGLTDAFAGYPMGVTAENVAKKYSITREDQDAFAAQSQQRAEIAMNNGRFDDEIIPVSVPQRKGDPLIVSVDEQPRQGVTPESLAGLKPIFDKSGSVTAANASTINDGAAMVFVADKQYALDNNLPILAEIISYTSTGVEPEIMGIGPISASSTCIDKAGWTVADLDLIELNEAFAAQALAVSRTLKLNSDIVNVNGGAIALGHPIGASGCRIFVTLLHEMTKRDAKRGLASLCIGGGMGTALCIARDS